MKAFITSDINAKTFEVTGIYEDCVSLLIDKMEDKRQIFPFSEITIIDLEESLYDFRNSSGIFANLVQYKNSKVESIKNMSLKLGF